MRKGINGGVWSVQESQKVGKGGTTDARDTYTTTQGVAEKTKLSN